MTRCAIYTRMSSELQRETGLTQIIKLASNENPLGASPKALEAIRAAMGDLQLYPNGGLDLREVLGRALSAGGGLTVRVGHGGFRITGRGSCGPW